MIYRLMTVMAVALGLQLPGAVASAANVLPASRLTELCASEAGDYKDGFCTGFILGSAYGLDGRPGSGVCVPDGITVRAVRDKVTGYLRAHARTSQQDASGVLTLAVKASFPCRR